MNRKLTKQDTFKVLGITGACVVLLLGISYVWQQKQTSNYRAEAFRVQALESGHSAELAAEGSGPIESNEQQSDPNFQP